MKFKVFLNPPTATAQEKKVSVVRGKPVFYNPPAVKKAKSLLISHLIQHKPDESHLIQHKPDEPFFGAVSLKVRWCFPKGKSHKDGEWRITRPDTDNLQKLLKDCMTQCDFWKDDAQVVREIAEKIWSNEPGIEIEIEKLEDKENGKLQEHL